MSFARFAIKLAYVMATEHVSEAMPAPDSLVVTSRLQGVLLSHPRDVPLRESRESPPPLPAAQRNKSRPRSLLD